MKLSEDELMLKIWKDLKKRYLTPSGWNCSESMCTLILNLYSILAKKGLVTSRFS